MFTGDDMHADKHKMERFLYEGHQAVASVYAPVTYPPMPLLAFDMSSGAPRLAFSGHSSCHRLTSILYFK